MTAGLTIHQFPNALIGLIRQLQRDDLATMEALFFDMTGNHAAAQMLRQLFRWWPKSKDGWVYKSHQDWWAELRIKQSELPKANGALAMVGVEIELRKAEGAPTKHYRLDAKRFWQAVRVTLKLSAKKLAALLQNAFRDSGKMDLVNGSKSITTSPQTNPSTNANAVLLDTAIQDAKGVSGISDYTARGLVAQYGPERVQAAVKLICSRRFNNPAGALVKALRDQWAHLPAEPAETNAFQENADPAKQRDDSDPSPLPPFPVAAPPGFPPLALPPEEVGQGDTTERDVDVTPAPEISQPESQEAKAWRIAYDQLSIQLDRVSFDTWLRGATFQRAENSVYVIGAPNSYSREMLQHRMYRDIRRVLSDVVGSDVEMRFEVVKPAPEKEPDEMPLFKVLARGGAK